MRLCSHCSDFSATPSASGSMAGVCVRDSVIIYAGFHFILMTRFDSARCGSFVSLALVTGYSCLQTGYQTPGPLLDQRYGNIPHSKPWRTTRRPESFPIKLGTTGPCAIPYDIASCSEHSNSLRFISYWCGMNPPLGFFAFTHRIPLSAATNFSSFAFPVHLAHRLPD